MRHLSIMQLRGTCFHMLILTATPILLHKTKHSSAHFWNPDTLHRVASEIGEWPRLTQKKDVIHIDFEGRQHYGGVSTWLIAFGRAGMRAGMLFRPAWNSSSAMHTICLEDELVSSSRGPAAPESRASNEPRPGILLSSMYEWSANGLPSGCTCTSAMKSTQNCCHQGEGMTAGLKYPAMQMLWCNGTLTAMKPLARAVEQMGCAWLLDRGAAENRDASGTVTFLRFSPADAALTEGEPEEEPAAWPFISEAMLPLVPTASVLP